jgi:DNA polymerase-3 subunit epsilon
MQFYDSLSALASAAIPADFVCIDTETANSTRSSLCAVGVALVRDGAVVAGTAELVDPQCEFNPFNTRVNGIDEAAVAGAQNLPMVWDDLTALCSGRTLAFHNATFDVGVLRSSAANYELPGFDAEVTCTMRLARRVWPTYPSYGLAVLCGELGIDLDHHQAGSDAAGCAEIALRLVEAVGATQLDELHAQLEMRPGLLGVDSFTPVWTTSTKLASLGPDPSANPDSPLYDTTVCFTGTLLSMIRRDAAELVSTSGGTFVNNMSKKVNLLVVGDADYIEFADGHRTGKLAKAAQLRADGEGPEIVREADFFRMIG